MSVVAARSTSATTVASQRFVVAHLARAIELGESLAELVGDPDAFVAALRSGFAELGHPTFVAGQRLVAPGIGAFVILWLWTQLSSINWLFALQWPSDPAQLIPFAWLLIGIAYVVWTSRFFRLPLPELKETHL